MWDYFKFKGKEPQKWWKLYEDVCVKVEEYEDNNYNVIARVTEKGTGHTFYHEILVVRGVEMSEKDHCRLINSKMEEVRERLYEFLIWRERNEKKN